jgi:S-adenosyl methyltransferase
VELLARRQRQLSGGPGSGRGVIAAFPVLARIARATRQFLGEAVQRLAAQHGVRQFPDIGAGLPTADNTHEVAQRVAPDSRVGYADNDPVVLAQAKALVTSTPEGKADFILADLHDPETILTQAARTLDFSQPVAVLLPAVLHFIAADANPAAIVARAAGGRAGNSAWGTPASCGNRGSGHDIIRRNDDGDGLLHLCP